MSNWYYRIGDKEHGPFCEADLKKAFVSDQLSLKTLVFRNGLNHWLEAGLCVEFKMEQTALSEGPKRSPNPPKDSENQAIGAFDKEVYSGNRKIQQISSASNVKSLINWAATILIIFIIYFVTTLFQRERSLYNKLNDLWAANSGSFDRLSEASEEIAQTSSDEDLRFTAHFLSVGAALYVASGIKDISEVKYGTDFNLGLTAFINGLKNPLDQLTSLPDFAWFTWNQSESQRRVAIIIERYGGLSSVGILSGLFGGCLFFFGLKRGWLKPLFKN